MQKKQKTVLLIVLIFVALVVWIPKRKQKAQAPVLPMSSPTSLEKQVLIKMPKQRKKSKFSDWGRNPFIWYKETTEAVADLALSGIMWDRTSSYAIINGEIVHVGEAIDGKTIKRIEPNKVILHDGKREYVLELN
jgi:hypothetical protein